VLLLPPSGGRGGGERRKEKGKKEKIRFLTYPPKAIEDREKKRKPAWISL